MQEPPQHDCFEAPRVVVVGAGRMGADIALAFALDGWRCDVVEINESVRAQALKYWQRELARLSRDNALAHLAMHEELDTVEWSDLDLVVETISEKLEVKHALLRDIEPRVSVDTLIGSNTSSLKITDVMRVLKHRDRGAGLHFGVPAHVMLAVEITKGDDTSDATMRRLVQWMEAQNKVPIVINRDVPGQIINRLQHAMYREIYHLIDEGFATVEDIDKAVRFGFGMRYAMIGPVISRDIHGLPVHLATAEQLYPTLHNGTEPSTTLKTLVAEGHHGVRTGQGFYRWEPSEVAERLRVFTERLERQIKQFERVGSPIDF